MTDTLRRLLPRCIPATIYGDPSFGEFCDYHMKRADDCRDEMAEALANHAEALAELVETAKEALALAEPDIAYEGEGFAEYLVPFDQMEGIRAALAKYEQQP